MEWSNEEANVQYTTKFNKKRKKKSFLSKQRTQGKRGRFGRGTEIDGDTFSYFLRVLEVNLSDFTTPEDKEVFIENVFEQTTGKEVFISCNQLGSRVMEKFLPCANDKILLRFISPFFMDMKEICCDEFGSHVLQQLIVVVSAFLQKTQSSKEEHANCQSSVTDVVASYNNWLLQVCELVVNNVEELMWDKYANHIIRTVLECLSGLPAGSTSKEKKREKKNQLATLEVETLPINEGPTFIKDIGNRILQMPQIVDCVCSDMTSGLLQTLLVVVHKVDHKLTRKFLRHLLDIVFDPKTEEFPEQIGNEKKKKKLNAISVPEIFTSLAATHLMDVMISVSSRKLFTKIYARCFINKLQTLSLAPGANFCVQNLIRLSTERIEFEGIFDELSTNFEALLHNKRHGVLLALGQSCQRLNCRQGQFMKELQKALHCVEPERLKLFPLLVACLVDYETWCESEKAEENIHKLPISLQGSLLLETLLNFPETIQIIKALLNMNCEHFKSLLCDSRGSYVADAFFGSKTVGEKSKDKFFRKLQGSYVELAVSKCGSRVLDAVWLWAPLNCKKLILEELAPKEVMINGFQWGSIFSEKSGLSLFKRRPKDWEECYSRENRKQKLFADLIGS